MANQKISEMDYNPLSKTDIFPTVNTVGLDIINSHAKAEDIIKLVNLYHWEIDKIYAAGSLVIYNSATTKGVFLVTTTTIAGNSPENAGYNKFKSVSLAFVPNNIPVVGFSPSISLGYLRTARLSFPVASPAISTGVYLISLQTSFTEAELRNAKIDCTVSHNGQFGNVQVRSATSGNSSLIAIYLEFFSNTSNAFNVDIKVEL